MTSVFTALHQDQGTQGVKTWPVWTVTSAYKKILWAADPLVTRGFLKWLKKLSIRDDRVKFNHLVFLLKKLAISAMKHVIEIWSHFELELSQNRMHMTSHGHASFDDFLVISKYPVNESYSMTYVNLSVPDLFDVCIERCETAQLECILSCENDLMCLSQCISEATSCIEGIFHFYKTLW